MNSLSQSQQDEILKVLSEAQEIAARMSKRLNKMSDIISPLVEIDLDFELEFQDSLEKDNKILKSLIKGVKKLDEID